MGAAKKRSANRGIEHHKQSLQETLDAPETYGVRVSIRATQGFVVHAVEMGH